MRWALVLTMVVVAACERSSSTDGSQTSTEVRAAMTELASYTERIYTIMRETNDCDAAAKQLEALVPAFQEIGPRMMKLKQRLDTLPPAERDRIKQESEQLTQGMKKRFADADA